MKILIKRILGYFGLTPDNIRWYVLKECNVDESWIIYCFFRKIKNEIEHPIMIDVGFAWGQASIPFLNMGWQVYAFEPDESPSKLTAVKNALVNFSKLHIDKCAVSDSSGEKLIFYVSSESEGISSLHSFKEHRPSHTVTTVSLDDFVFENKIEKIDYLKIDTEGHDFFVLKGLTLEKMRPKVFLIEFDELKTISLGYRYQDIGDHLLLNGYTVWLFEWYPIIKYGTKHKFRRFSKYPTSLNDEKAWGNFIAIQSPFDEEFEKFLKNSRYKIFYES